MKEQIKIRNERKEDYEIVEEITREAFYKWKRNISPVRMNFIL